MSQQYGAKLTTNVQKTSQKCALFDRSVDYYNIILRNFKHTAMENANNQLEEQIVKDIFKPIKPIWTGSFFWKNHQLKKPYSHIWQALLIVAFIAAIFAIGAIMSGIANFINYVYWG